MSQKRKSDQELDNCQFRLILERDREQLLAEAKSEILRHEYWADLAEKNICELKRQIDSQAVEIGHTRTGYEQSRREQALLHEELADRERALLDSRVRSIQKLEEFKRDQEFRLEEFSVRKLVEHHFKDVECVRSGQLFHVTIQPALFLLPPWTRRIAKPRLKFAARMVFQETFLQIHMRILRQFIQECSITWIDFSFTGNILVQVSTGKPW